MTLGIIFGLFLISIFVILLIIRLWLNNLEAKTRLSDELVTWLKTSTIQFNERFDNAVRVIADIQKNLGELSKINYSINELHEFLASPKSRGNIGEQLLKELLTQYFPRNLYELQYAFANGEKVDAVIKTSQGLIPIDSKFPMENFRRMIRETDKQLKEKFEKNFINDVKKHIENISKKYILVEEKTSDYALMYIPSESIYYEIINNTEIFDFAGRMRVLPVSPMSFYAYMKAILMSYESQRIQSQAKEILEILKAIKKDYEKSEESLTILSRHLTNAYNQMIAFAKNFNLLGQKIAATHLISDEKNKQKLIE